MDHFVASGNFHYCHRRGDLSEGWIQLASTVLLITLTANLLTMLVELTITHPTKDAKKAVDMILSGRYKLRFWLGVVLLGNVVPLVLLMAGLASSAVLLISAVLVLAGIYLTEHIWVEAPQRIPLS